MLFFNFELMIWERVCEKREKEREFVCWHCLVLHIIHMIHITVDVFLTKDSKMDLLSGTSKRYLFDGGQTGARKNVRKLSSKIITCTH